MDVVFCFELDSEDDVEDNCLLAFAEVDPSEVVTVLEEVLDSEGNTAEREEVLKEFEDWNGMNAEVACMMEVVDEEELDDTDSEESLVAGSIF